MKKFSRLFLTNLVLLFLFTGCQKTSSQTWEDVKTAGRYLNRGFDALIGRYDDSKPVHSDNDFESPEEGDYIGLNEADLKTSMQHSDAAIAQSKYLPGEKGGVVPNLTAFKEPQNNLKSLFNTLHFATDDHIVRSREDLTTVHKIALYLKKHSNSYVCIEGHCDERAPSAYNMALGSRRANQVRVLLIKQGVSVDRLYPISYGKEKPLSFGHAKVDWDKNRRCEFKLYTKNTAHR